MEETKPLSWSMINRQYYLIDRAGDTVAEFRDLMSAVYAGTLAFPGCAVWRDDMESGDEVIKYINMWRQDFLRTLLEKRYFYNVSISSVTEDQSLNEFIYTKFDEQNNSIEIIFGEYLFRSEFQDIFSEMMKYNRLINMMEISKDSAILRWVDDTKEINELEVRITI